MALATLLLLAGCGSSSSSSASRANPAPLPASSPPAPSTPATSTARQSTPTVGFEGIELERGPSLAPAAGTTPGSPVDGIQCGSTEQLAYHIHAHLAVFVEGRSFALPAGIGIPGALVQQSQFGPVVGQGQCFYWLHTHTSDGILHIESPSARIYTLANLFDEWRQPLSADRVGPARGAVTAFVDGKPWKRDPRSIPLLPHTVVQLDVGTPVTPYQGMSFRNSQL